MAKSLFIFYFFVFTTASALAQNPPDSLSESAETDCGYVAWRATSLIMKYYQAHNPDSTLQVLNDWQTTCGPGEPITRTRILLAISDHAFDENIYDSTIVNDILNYMQRMESKSPAKLYQDYPAYFGFVPIRDAYDYFTQSLADSLLSREFDSPLELLFCQFYANIVTNPLKEIKNNPLYDNTVLKSVYMGEVQKILEKPDYNLNFLAGIWIPTGHASILGKHPEIGLQAGAKYHKMMYNLTLSIKFIDTPGYYTVLKDGAKDSTTYFLGGYLGLNIERELLKFKKNEFGLLWGVGYDGFETLRTDLNTSESTTGKTIKSLNMNFGLGYRYFYKPGKYIGFQAKYNILNYNNHGGTNLIGDCLTFSITMGALSNPDKENELYQLRYQ